MLSVNSLSYVWFWTESRVVKKKCALHYDHQNKRDDAICHLNLKY